ncbi:HSP70 family molecular chaperone [Methylocella silvestris BL2]|uniref:HSP70 family molecular chaperone n=1 Tax=Methylocella silvestris (strain DSM 15510 / CIP 108128 / LMG 27833 / NCIMB 13906 / BL2) TaxID=395965 RepID=B8EP58_METSB|nr:Hsp70 family protein [Methylocella silvestris]ACK49646.1 HSP70 family molecular chaperone [Methylocella silvestris BL2]
MTAAASRLAGVGVDFGTTNSVVALAYENGEVESLSWPSQFGATDTYRTALMFWREGRRIAHASGPAAIARAVAGDGEQRFIQSIKTYLASRLFSETRLYGQRFTIEQLVATFLSDLLADLRLSAGANAVQIPILSGRPVVFAGEDPDEDLAVARLQSAYALAGFHDVALAFEPFGAAYWYARRLEREETVLVADFGGGTSDFSIMRFSRKDGALTARPLAHTGVGVAGDSFDYRIIDHVIAPKLGKGAFYRSFDKRLPIPAYFHAAFAQWHQLSWLKTAQTLGELRKLIQSAEEPEPLEDLMSVIQHDLGFELYRSVGALKARLSDEESARFSFSREGIQIEADVSRAEFEAWIAPDLKRIGACVDQAVAAAGLKPAAIDAVFLTGGTSFVPSVRALFTERFGGPRVHIGDAFQSVASGLALIAAERVGAGQTG